MNVQANEETKYQSGITGRAEVRFGGKIFIDTFTIKGRPLAGIGLAEFYSQGEVGETNADQRVHEPQVMMLFDNMRSLDALQGAIDTVRELLKRQLEQQPADTPDGDAKPGQNYGGTADPRSTDPMLDTDLRLTNLSVRTLNICANNGVRTIRELARLQKTDLLKFRNAGKGTLTEIDDFLTTAKLTWGMDV